MNEAMTDAVTKPTDPVALSPAVSEDRRRPKARAPYTALWIITVLCTVFALTAMFLQR